MLGEAEMADWNVGDLALCVWNGPWTDGTGRSFAGPSYGQLLIVGAVQVVCCQKHLFLGFKQFGAYSYFHENFRKVPPIDDNEERAEAALLGAGLEPVEATWLNC
jgi:hypothetical protein